MARHLAQWTPEQLRRDLDAYTLPVGALGDPIGVSAGALRHAERMRRRARRWAWLPEWLKPESVKDWS